MMGGCTLTQVVPWTTEWVGVRILWWHHVQVNVDREDKSFSPHCKHWPQTSIPDLAVPNFEVLWWLAAENLI